MTKRLVLLAMMAALLVVPASATATPVATSDDEYSALGAVFPDPMGGCPLPVCSPYAQGNVPATQFIQVEELQDALRYMNQQEEWRNYMEVWPLDDGTFPGNNLGRLEFDPKSEYVSAGLPTSTLDRHKSDLMVVRVTDETVPDEGKKRYALSLSIHGIERAGAEGGTRAMEDLVTAHTTGKAGEPILPTDVKPGAPSFEDVLKKTIIYFTWPNPDGWRRGSITDFADSGGFFFQRYNGNGVDPNRDWTDIGYSFRGYSGFSEPESRAYKAFFEGVESKTGDQFAAGDDLHGQPHADALSYTMMPHGRHDWAKNTRLTEAAKTIHAVSEKYLAWSPYIQPNDAPPADCVGQPLGDTCSRIYGQTWGTVYDTINYTTTGTLGDWFDSNAGLGADGIDNEMSFSHLDKNIVFDPHTEQLHVDGNKALIYAHIAEMLVPPAASFDAKGDKKGFVPNERLTREEQVNQPEQGEGGQPQGPIDFDPKPQTSDRTIYDFRVDPNAANGGFRAEVTLANVEGVAPSYTVVGNQVKLQVQCRGCEDHHGEQDAREKDWVVAAEDYNQKQLYMSSGLVATVNRPQAISADKTPVDWRLVVSGVHVGTDAKITFTKGPASADGDVTGGSEPPRLAGYDVANTDFFADLEKYDAQDADGYDRIDARKVIAGEQSLGELDTLVLADDALPGYTGDYGEPPTGSPSPDEAFQSELTTIPGARDPAVEETFGPLGRVPGSYETYEWEVSPDAANKSMTVRVDWGALDDDFDMYLYRFDEEGEEQFVSQSTNTGGSSTWEEIRIGAPTPGRYKLYVDNWLADTPEWTGKVTYEAYPAPESGPTGDYTEAEKDAWIAKLRQFVEGGGNLVLTDGAVPALADLTTIPQQAIAEQVVYVGQVTFSDGENTTLEHPLNAGIQQPGARFNTGMRRQTFEATPLGFAIQNPRSGGDESHSPQFDVKKEAFEAAGGTVAGTSVDSGTRDAGPVHDRVALGEIKLGEGTVRIAGALLPQPSQDYDHPLGIEPYALTYTGYILARNLMDHDRTPAPPPSDEEPTGGPTGGETAPPPPPAPPAPASAGDDGAVAGDGAAPARVAFKARTARASRSGRFTLPASCAGDDCRGRLVARSGRRTLGAGTFRLEEGETRGVRLRLSRRGLALLRREGRLRLTVAAVSGERTLGRRTITLIAARR